MQPTMQPVEQKRFSSAAQKAAQLYQRIFRMSTFVQKFMLIKTNGKYFPLLFNNEWKIYQKECMKYSIQTFATSKTRSALVTHFPMQCRRSSCSVLLVWSLGRSTCLQMQNFSRRLEGIGMIVYASKTSKNPLPTSTYPPVRSMFRT